MEFRNGTRMRKDKNKPGPSGDSRNNLYLMPEKWGGRDLLQPVDLDIIRALKEEVGGDGLLHFVEPEYAARAEQALHSLGMTFSAVEFDNVWFVF